MQFDNEVARNVLSLTLYHHVRLNKLSSRRIDFCIPSIDELFNDRDVAITGCTM